MDETVTRYDWDTENQLTRVTKHEMETALPSETITYAYDALGRRIEKRIMDEKGNETSKKYVYDNEDILMEFNGEGLFQKFYVHGLGIDNPLAMLKDNEETRNDTEDLKAYYYHKDGMNSITSLTDESGDEVEKYIYNAFGKMTVFDERDRKIASSKLGNPYSFTGREHDSETGLHYHRARYYNPELARWISEDPIEFNSGDMNLYRYVENNPVNWFDLLGLDRLLFNDKNILWYDDNNKKIDEFPAKSGTPKKPNLRLPEGKYKVSRPKDRDDNKGMICKDEKIGYSANLDPLFNTKRTLFRIHPDGNVPGTAGCIGVKCKGPDKRFKKRLDEYFKKNPNAELILEVKYED